MPAGGDYGVSLDEGDSLGITGFSPWGRALG